MADQFYCHARGVDILQLIFALPILLISQAMHRCAISLRNALSRKVEFGRTLLSIALIELSKQSYRISMTSVELPIISFSSPSAFKRWLEAQPRKSAGAWIKFSRKGAVEPTISKSDAIDLALAHGWIDGQLGQVDELYYRTRFTPRKPKSVWSKINCERAERLIESGQMTQQGLAKVEAAKADGRWERAYAPQSTAVPHDDLKAALDADPNVRQVFKELDSANRYAVIYRVHQAKTAEKRAAKIAELMAMLRRGQTIHPRRGKPDPNS